MTPVFVVIDTETPNPNRQIPKKQQKSSFDFSLEIFLAFGVLGFGIFALRLAPELRPKSA
jgi:hypothetical protein